MPSATVSRVPEHTKEEVNARIRYLTEARIAYYGEHPEEIDRRLRQLDEEWDIERVLEANASALAFSGTMLGLFVAKKWLLLPAVVTGFLFQHAIQGWCPPIALLRRLGVRTPREIEWERNALKAIRGDYEGVRESDDRSHFALMAARR